MSEATFSIRVRQEYKENGRFTDKNPVSFHYEADVPELGHTEWDATYDTMLDAYIELLNMINDHTGWQLAIVETLKIDPAVLTGQPSPAQHNTKN